MLAYHALAHDWLQVRRDSSWLDSAWLGSPTRGPSWQSLPAWVDYYVKGKVTLIKVVMILIKCTKKQKERVEKSIKPSSKPNQVTKSLVFIISVRLVIKQLLWVQLLHNLHAVKVSLFGCENVCPNFADF